MARPKATEITSKIIELEKLRLQALMQDVAFPRDLRQLEKSAKLLPLSRLIPVSELTEENWKLPADDKTKFLKWSKAAKIFENRWGFKPYLDETNAVVLHIRSPVSFSMSVETGAITETKIKHGDHSLSDIVALLQYHFSLRTRRQAKFGKGKARRHNLDTMRLGLRLGELDAMRKTDEEIAADLYPGEYKALLGDPAVEEKFRRLVRGYLDLNLQWRDAALKASKEVGFDLRTKAARLKPLIQRVRDLRKSHAKP